jgi:hypothetical protein
LEKKKLGQNEFWQRLYIGWGSIIMSFSNDQFSEISAFEYNTEVVAGILFPNWTSCRYRENFCPEICRKHREASLLKKYCSNNDSIRSCRMYQVLDEVLGFNGALRECYDALGGVLHDSSKVNDFMKGCYDSLAGVLGDASDNFLTELHRLYEDVSAICAEIEKETA